MRLNDTYKQDWHDFVQVFKKQISSQKSAYYAQVEALNLVKENNETVRHFELNVQQLVEKGWCNENAFTIYLKCNEILTTQPRDPNKKNNPAYKKYCSYCHRKNHSISACFKKQRDDEDKRDAYGRSKSPQKSFVQYFRSPSYDRTKRYYTRYRSRSTSRNNYCNKNNISQNRYRSTSRDRFSYDKSTTPPQNTRSRYDNYKRDSRSYRSPYRSSHKSPQRRDSRHKYRSRSNSRDINIFTHLLLYT